MHLLLCRTAAPPPPQHPGWTQAQHRPPQQQPLSAAQAGAAAGGRSAQAPQTVGRADAQLPCLELPRTVAARRCGESRVAATGGWLDWQEVQHTLSGAVHIRSLIPRSKPQHYQQAPIGKPSRSARPPASSPQHRAQRSAGIWVLQHARSDAAEAQPLHGWMDGTRERTWPFFTSATKGRLQLATHQSSAAGRQGPVPASTQHKKAAGWQAAPARCGPGWRHGRRHARMHCTPERQQRRQSDRLEQGVGQGVGQGAESSCRSCTAHQLAPAAQQHTPTIGRIIADRPPCPPTFQMGSSANCTNRGLTRPCWSLCD